MDNNTLNTEGVVSKKLSLQQTLIEHKRLLILFAILVFLVFSYTFIYPSSPFRVSNDYETTAFVPSITELPDISDQVALPGNTELPDISDQVDLPGNTKLPDIN